MKRDATAFGMTLIRIFVQKPFFFCKLVGLGMMGVIFLIFLGMFLFSLHQRFFAADSEATITGISQKIGDGSSSFHASYNDDGWKTESKDITPQKQTYHYTLRFIDEDGKVREEEVDSLSETPLALKLGEKLTIYYSTLLRGLVWSEDAAFAREGEKSVRSAQDEMDEMRKILLIGIAIALILYYFGRIGIAFTDKILAVAQDSAIRAMNEQKDKENPDA